ncbi:MAG TPA: VCBS repeat-containing protein [Desulfatiglandales bacterium]|nr:VCBS repeat-containing protein [Desulfatiglandales bacterium]
MKTKKRYHLIFFFLIILHVFFCNTLSAKQQAKILVLPLTIHSEKDLSFLRNGIEDMLSTRLAHIGEVFLLSRGETKQAIKDILEQIDEKKAVLLGQEYQSDFVLFGSLTIFGDSISTDLRFIDVPREKPVVIFNQSGKSHGDVITHINLFTDQITEGILGGGMDAGDVQSQKEFAAQGKRPGDVITGEGMDKEDSYGLTAEKGETPSSLWRSKKFKTQIKGIAIGDLDSDGKNETVFISSNRIFIYRYTGKTFAKVKEIQGKSQDNFIGVDVADINNNGKPEIFITTFIQHNNRLNSFVLEWKESNFETISDGENWYYRVLYLPGRGSVLFGQKLGMKDFFTGAVYELNWINGRYEPLEKQNLPKHINIYGFTYGDVLNNGQEMIASFATKDRILISDKKGDEKWLSSESYGGNAAYIELPIKPGSSKDNIEEMNRFYLPQRIHIADVDKDGKNEVIAVRNEDTAHGLFSRLRIFKTGYIELLAWNDDGLEVKWKTKAFSRYISDYVIADLNNDGENELVFSVVSATDTAFGDPRSYIVSMVLNK